MKAKIGEVLKFCFETRQVRLYHQLVQFCLLRKELMIPLGYGTIAEYATQFGIDGPDFVLVGFENILYSQTQKEPKKVVGLLVSVFSEAVL